MIKTLGKLIGVGTLLVIIFAVGAMLFGCGGQWQPDEARPRGMTARVIGKTDCINWFARACAPYMRLEDNDEQISVHLLLSDNQTACVVSGSTIIKIKIGDEYICQWRRPR